MKDGSDGGSEALLAHVLGLESAAARSATVDEAVRLWIEAAALRRDRLGDVDGAIAALRRGVQVHPGHRLLLNRYAQVCAGAGRWSELVDILELSARVARSDDERARVLAHRGDVLGKKLGRIAEARSIYREVSRLATDPVLATAAQEAVERIDVLLSPQRGTAPRERTFVGRVRGLSTMEPPPTSVSERPVADDRVEQINRAARAALDAGRRVEARALVEQSLALRAWNDGAIRLRRDVLRAERRWDELVRLLVAESEEAPSPHGAAMALIEAAEVSADALSDRAGAMALVRRATAYPGQEERSMSRGARLAVRHKMFDAAQKIRPELRAEPRAEWLDQLASAALAAGDAEAALALRALGFEDAVGDVAFFQARVQVLERAGDAAGVEAALLRRLAQVVDPDERRAMAWELSASCEAQGRWRDAVQPLLELVVHAAHDAEVEEVLASMDRLSNAASDRSLYVRGLEVAARRSRGKVSRWMVILGRVLRDEMVDAEGAVAVLGRARALGADVSTELAVLGVRLDETHIPAGAPAVDDSTEHDGPPLVMGVEDPSVEEPEEPQARTDEVMLRGRSDPHRRELDTDLEQPVLAQVDWPARVSSLPPAGEDEVTLERDVDGLRAELAQEMGVLGAAVIEEAPIEEVSVVSRFVGEGEVGAVSWANAVESPLRAEDVAAALEAARGASAEADPDEVTQAPVGAEVRLGDAASALGADGGRLGGASDAAAGDVAASVAAPREDPPRGGSEDAAGGADPGPAVALGAGAELASVAEPGGDVASDAGSDRAAPLASSAPAAPAAPAAPVGSGEGGFAEEARAGSASEPGREGADAAAAVGGASSAAAEDGAIVGADPARVDASAFDASAAVSEDGALTAVEGASAGARVDADAGAAADASPSGGAVGPEGPPVDADAVAERPSALVAAAAASPTVADGPAAGSQALVGQPEGPVGWVKKLAGEPDGAAAASHDAVLASDVASSASPVSAIEPQPAPAGSHAPALRSDAPGAGPDGSAIEPLPAAASSDDSAIASAAAGADALESAGASQVSLAGARASDLPPDTRALGAPTIADTSTAAGDPLTLGPRASASEAPAAGSHATGLASELPREAAGDRATPSVDASVAASDRAPSAEVPASTDDLATPSADAPVSANDRAEALADAPASADGTRTADEAARTDHPAPTRDPALDPPADGAPEGGAAPTHDRAPAHDANAPPPEGGAVPEDVDEPTTDGARVHPASEEVTDAGARIALPREDSPSPAGAPPAPRVIAPVVEELVPAALARRIEPMADAVIAGEEVAAARWLAAGRHALAVGCVEIARVCFGLGLDQARRERCERAAVALVDEAWASVDVDREVPRSTWTPRAASLPELSPGARVARRARELDGHVGRALAARAAAIAAILTPTDPIEERWLEAAAEAEPESGAVVATLYERAMERADVAGARRWIERAIAAREPPTRWWLRAAELEANAGDPAGAAAALGQALDAAPLEIEPARRLAELGVEVGERGWIDRGLAELLERYLWSRATNPATFVALVRCALGTGDAGDALLAAVAREARSEAPPLDPALPEERRRLEHAFAVGDVEALGQMLDPASADGRRRLLLVLSPPFLLADLP